MYKIYRCKKCNDEAETPLSGCFIMNPLGVKPRIDCPYIEECTTEWFEIDATGEAVLTALMPTGNNTPPSAPPVGEIPQSVPHGKVYSGGGGYTVK